MESISFSQSPTIQFMKSALNSLPYNNIRDAFIQLKKWDNSKIMASSAIEKLLPLGQEIGFGTRFGLKKERKIPEHSLTDCSVLVEHLKCYDCILGTLSVIFSGPDCYCTASWTNETQC